MTISRSSLLRIGAGGTAASVREGAGWAEAYPARLVWIIVGCGHRDKMVGVEMFHVPYRGDGPSLAKSPSRTSAGDDDCGTGPSVGHASPVGT
jgi:hypothetical protein